MSLCDEAVHYSPVAKFVDGHYVEGSAGVFLQCITEDEYGFQVRKCFVLMCFGQLFHGFYFSVAVEVF